MLFLNHNLSGISLLPVEEWQKCFNEIRPIGSIGSKEIFIAKDHDSDNPGLIIGDGHSGIWLGGEDLPTLDFVLDYFQYEIKSDAESILALVKAVENIRLHSHPHPPLTPPVQPAWKTEETPV